MLRGAASETKAHPAVRVRAVRSGETHLVSGAFVPLFRRFFEGSLSLSACLPFAFPPLVFLLRMRKCPPDLLSSQKSAQSAHHSLDCLSLPSSEGSFLLFHKKKAASRGLFPYNGTPVAQPPHQSKIFEGKGVGFGEGEGKLSLESFPSPSPIFYSPIFLFSTSSASSIPAGFVPPACA